MQHLGDITKINGAEVLPVDVIIGGSPCQDLSVAGNRTGLSGKRSGLFMEQIRIIKEMRNATRDRGATVLPRYMVWENVPGAFSSNNGEDFRIVLEETARVVDENAVIPRPADWKWRTSGAIVADGWSIAWRVLDAQFWGVPQRRRRIALIADFNGQSAPEILFVKESVLGRAAESGETRQGTSADTQSGVGTAIGFDGYNQSVTGDKSKTLKHGAGTDYDSIPCICLQGNGIDRADTAGCNGKGWTEDVCYTLNTVDRPAVCVLDDQGGSFITTKDNAKVAPTLRSEAHLNIPVVCYKGEQITSPVNASNPKIGDPCHTLDSRGAGNTYVCYDMTHADEAIRECGDISPTLQQRMGTGGNQVPLVMATQQGGAEICRDLCPTITAMAGMSGNNQPVVCMQDTVGALCAADSKWVSNQTLNQDKLICYAIGNGQADQTGKGDNYGNTILQILQEAFDSDSVWQWCERSTVAIQKANILQQGMHEGGISRETTYRNIMDDDTLPCAETVAEWCLRDMREHEKCGCSSQGRESAEQRHIEFNEVMSELSRKSTSRGKALCDMWSKGKGVWLLRQALSAFQEIRQSVADKEERYIVRRLTPLEAERLQGYPDGWTRIGELVGYDEYIKVDDEYIKLTSSNREQYADYKGEIYPDAVYEYIDDNGKKHKCTDSHRYQALGNSIALPVWKWVLKRLCACYERDATMASLFDGISGFPYLWEQLNGKDSCLWSSEIDEYCVAVSKYHFGG